MTKETVNMKQTQYDEMISKLKENAHPKKGIALGILFGIIGAVLWAVIVILTGYNIGFVAIAVGYLVSFGFEKAGKSLNQVYGIIAGVISIMSIFLGEIFCFLAEIAKYYEMTFVEVAGSVDYTYLLKAIVENYDYKSLIFYFIAVSVAFKRSYINENNFNVIIEPDNMPLEA